MQTTRFLPKALHPVLFCGALCVGVAAFSQPSQADELTDCMNQAMSASDDSVTIGDIRRECLKKQNVANPLASTPTIDKGAAEKRLVQERKNVLKPFTITAHRPNYILPLAYNMHGYSAEHYGVQSDGEPYDFDRVEAQFQLSIKAPLMVDLFNGMMDVYAAYTNHSFWQVYNTSDSSPFRETTHEPEAWVQFHPNWELFGIKNTWNHFGINHQSNGQSGGRSRSWNRVFASFTFEYDNFALTLRPWVRIFDEGEKSDNPNISDYLGHYDMLLAYKMDHHTFSLKERNNLESNFSRGSVELGWSFPLGDWPFMRGYVQYFSGYGESLIDYDRYVNRLGVGLSLSDWL